MSKLNIVVLGVNKLKNRIRNISLFLLILAIPFLIVEYQLSYSKPQEALYNESNIQTDANFKVKQIIASRKLNDEAIIFFLNENESISVAFVYKGILGWKSGVLVHGSTPRLTNIDPSNFVTGHTIAFGRVLYGLISSPEVKAIQIEDRTATILPLEFYLKNEKQIENLKLWYIISDHLNSNIKIDFVNQEGKVIHNIQ